MSDSFWDTVWNLLNHPFRTLDPASCMVDVANSNPAAVAPSLCEPVAHPMLGADVWVFRVIDVAGVLGTALALTTILYGTKVLSALRVPRVQPNRSNMQRLALLTFMWAIVPPVWFWSEYWFLYVPQGNGTANAFAQFRHGQQLSAAIWAGLLAASATILSRAFARELTLPAKDPAKDAPVYAIYGSTSASAMSSEATHVLLWHGEDRNSANGELEKLMNATPFAAFHLVCTTGMQTSIETRSRFAT